MLQGRLGLYLPARPRVPEVVEPEARETGCRTRIAPRLGADLLDRRAAPKAENVVSVMLWVLDPLREYDERVRIERHYAGVIRLRIRGRHERRRPLQIDVRAFELRDLRSPHSGGAGKDRHIAAVRRQLPEQRVNALARFP